MTQSPSDQIYFSWDRVICKDRSNFFIEAYQTLFPPLHGASTSEVEPRFEALTEADRLLLNATLFFRRHEYRHAIETCRLILQIEAENLAVSLILLYSIAAIGASIEDFLMQPIAGWAAKFPEFPLAVIDCAHARGNEPLAYRIMSMLNFAEGNQHKRDALFRSSLVVFDRQTAERLLEQKAPIITTMEPFQSLLAFDDPDLHLTCALNASNSRKEDQIRHPAPSIRAHARLKVGYISPDFRMHPTTLLLWKMFEFHDERKFDIHLLSTLDTKVMANAEELKRGGVDPWFDHYKSNVKNFFLLPTRDLEREEAIRSFKLDLLIDLNGHARGGCQSLFNQRPARIQAAYLGYPGTTGNPDIDYLIADDTVVFDGNRGAFTETVVSLPGFYQINSYRHFASTEVVTRSAYGLPDTGTIFCSFNAAHKITGETFDLWCEILLSTPGSVLWLLHENDLQVAAMSDRAKARGLELSRLIFAHKWHFEAHLTRLGAADIMLDCFPYGGHTTAVDAAWRGVPCVTRYGRSFQARVAMSMNEQLGLGELNCADARTYVKTAISLAIDARRLLEMRKKLEGLRFESLVFDTKEKTRNLERIFLQIT